MNVLADTTLTVRVSESDEAKPRVTLARVGVVLTALVKYPLYFR